MANDRLNRYVWILETIRICGRITLKELSRRWVLAGFSSDGLPRRTFHNYRNIIEEIFSVNIQCDRATYEYFINKEDLDKTRVTEWMFNNAAVNSIIADSSEVAERILVEEVPSSREFLAPVLDAIKGCSRIRFTYHSYTRIKPKTGILFEPYFLKLFRQRWYVTGREISPVGKSVRTYALDRMSDVNVLDERFVFPDDFDPKAYTRDSFGIVFDMGELADVRLRVSSYRAKYLRALPLHHSQKEEIMGDTYSIFSLHIRITPDFVEELLSMGADVIVESPESLRKIVVTRLEEALNAYHR